jgi:ribosomal protein S24E
METTITSVRENPLLDRREVELEVDHEGESTPAQEDIKERLAAENNLDLEKIEVDSVYTGYGSNKSRVSLKVYEEFEYDEELERNPEEEQSPEQQEETTQATAEYEEIVSGTITDAKDALEDMDEPDYDAALAAEKEGKNRTTLVEWLEDQL